MSGHNKWAQIKHKKAATDKKKAQIFGRLSRLITIAARKGTDPKMNVALAQAVDQARSMNMPNDNIDRAIKKVSDKSSSSLEELTIEAIGPANTAIRIKAVTDSRNRTINEIRLILTQNHGKMVPPGSINWMFGQGAQKITDPAISARIESLLEALDNNEDVEDVSINITD